MHPPLIALTEIRKTLILTCDEPADFPGVSRRSIAYILNEDRQVPEDAMTHWFRLSAAIGRAEEKVSIPEVRATVFLRHWSSEDISLFGESTPRA